MTTPKLGTSMPNTEYYNDKVVRQFLLAAAVWGIIGMSVGVWIAAELMWPALNFDIPFITFSRLRPDHTFGVIFAFGGSALMGTCYYVVQRTGHARLAFDKLAEFTFIAVGLLHIVNNLAVPVSLTKSYPTWR